MVHYQDAYVDYYASFLLFILIVIIVSRKDVITLLQRLFFTMSVVCFVLLLFEGTTYLINTVDRTGLSYLNYGLNTMLYLGTALLGTLWANYIDFSLHRDVTRLQHHGYYLFPILLAVPLLIINFVTPIVFSIDAGNVYQREIGIYLMMGVLIALSVYMIILIVRNRNRVQNKLLRGLIAFIVLPMIGGLLQMAFYGFTSQFSMFALALMTVYIIIENVTANRDELTNLFTRNKIMGYIDNLISRHMEFSLIMFDMDNLKDINDQHGHMIGDNALIRFTDTIDHHFKDPASMVSRVGGDEILVVTSVIDQPLLQQRVQSIKQVIQTEHSVPVRFSFGMVSTNEFLEVDSDALLQRADVRMYQDKAVNKNQKRRKTDKED